MNGPGQILPRAVQRFGDRTALVIAFTDDRLAAYKRPRLVRFLADLPKTSSGKVMRRELIKSFKP